MESSTSSALVAGSSSFSDISKTVEETNLSKYFNNEIQREDVCERIKVVDIEKNDCNEKTWEFHDLAGMLRNSEVVIPWFSDVPLGQLKPIVERAFEFFSRLLKTAIFNVPKGIITDFHDGLKVVESLVERSCLKANVELSHIRKVIEEVEGLSNMPLQTIPQAVNVWFRDTKPPFLLLNGINMKSISAVTLVILDILPYLGKADFAAEKSRVMNLCSKLVSLFEIEDGPTSTEAEMTAAFESVVFPLNHLFPWCLFVLHLLNTTDAEIVSKVRLLKAKHDTIFLGHFLSAVRILKSIGQKHELFDEGKMTQIQNSFYTFSSQIDDVEAMVNYFLPFQSLVSSVVCFSAADFNVVEELRMIFSQEIYSRENISSILQKNLEKSPKSTDSSLTKVTFESFVTLLRTVHTSQEMRLTANAKAQLLYLQYDRDREFRTLVMLRNPIMDVVISFWNKVDMPTDRTLVFSILNKVAMHTDLTKPQEATYMSILFWYLKDKNDEEIEFANIRFSYFTKLYMRLCIIGGLPRDDEKSSKEKKKARKVPCINNIIFMNICDFLGWSSPKCHKQYISGSHIPKYFNVDQDKGDYVEAISKNAIRQFFGMQKDLSSKRKTENSPNELESLKRIRS